MSDFLTKDIDTSNFFKLIDKNKAIEILSNRHEENIQFISIIVEKTNKDLIKPEDYKRFLETCRRVVHSSFCTHPLLAFEVDLVSYDKKSCQYVNKDGTFFKMMPIDFYGGYVAKKEDIEHRSQMTFAFVSSASIEELKEQFGDIFVLEGELAKK